MSDVWGVVVVLNVIDGVMRCVGYCSGLYSVVLCCAVLYYMLWYPVVRS